MRNRHRRAHPHARPRNANRRRCSAACICNRARFHRRSSERPASNSDAAGGQFESKHDCRDFTPATNRHGPPRCGPSPAQQAHKRLHRLASGVSPAGDSPHEAGYDGCITILAPMRRIRAIPHEHRLLRHSSTSSVMAGLVPAIYDFYSRNKDMDGRDKPCHDGSASNITVNF
jgi:hypothetical protein